MEEFSYHVDILNSSTASTEQKLEALDELAQAGLTFDYQPAANQYGLDDYDQHFTRPE